MTSRLLTRAPGESHSHHRKTTVVATITAYHKPESGRTSSKTWVNPSAPHSLFQGHRAPNLPLPSASHELQWASHRGLTTPPSGTHWSGDYLGMYACIHVGILAQPGPLQNLYSNMNMNMNMNLTFISALPNER